MYLYFQPQGGFNDTLVGLDIAIQFCQRYNRKLLLDTFNVTYKINFSDYFEFSNYNIIGNKNDIIKTKHEKDNDVYPSCFNGKMLNLINGEYTFDYNGNFSYQNISLNLPDTSRNETIIVHASCGGGDGYKMFKQLHPSFDIKKICNERYKLLTNHYLCIQVRNTDYKCDYEKLYYNYKDSIHSYNCIYVSTDCKKVIDFFKSKGLNIFNFTHFPSEDEYNNSYQDKCYSLHCDKHIDSHTKIVDLMADIYIIALCDNLLSCSHGGFIDLVRKCKNHKNDIINQFQIDT